MTQDEIIEMARQSGMVYRSFEDEFANANTDGVDLKTMIAFAKLVADKEREACAKVAEDTDRMVLALLNVTSQPKHIANAIRARGEA